MTIRNISFSLNEYYHIYSRGVDKRIIFADNSDRQRFVRLMFLCNGEKPVIYRNTEKLPFSEIDMGKKIVGIGAYCLMPNHFHILAREIEDGGIVKFMSKLLTAYSAYFNKRHVRTGALFSSEFKAHHLDSDEYLKYIFAYIHLNPLKILNSKWRENKIEKTRAKKYLDGYFYSSYPEYCSNQKVREYSLVLDRDIFPDYFKKKGDFEVFMNDWITLDPNT